MISGWPPIVIRNRQYRELIAAFQSAQQRDRLSRGDNAGWEFQIQLADKQTSVQLKASPQNSVKIKYKDEGAERELYQHVDYSSPIELRTTGDILYVYWGEIMLGKQYWLPHTTCVAVVRFQGVALIQGIYGSVALKSHRSAGTA